MALLYGALLLCNLYALADALQLSFQPPQGAFFTRYPSHGSGDARDDDRIVGRFPFFLHRQCPFEPLQRLHATHTTFSAQVPLSRVAAAPNSSCGVAVRLVTTSVSMVLCYEVVDGQRHCASDFKYEEKSFEWDAKKATHALGEVELKTDYANYVQMPIDGDMPWSLSLLVPNFEFHPRMVFAVHVFFEFIPQLHSVSAPLYFFQIRSWIKSGLKILAVENVTDSAWSIRTELNEKHSTMRTTCFFRNQIDFNETLSGPVFSLLLQVGEFSSESEDRSTEIEWAVRYVLDAAASSAASTQNVFQSTTAVTDATTGRKGIGNVFTRLTISKDRIYALTPLSQSFELINTAAVSGEQISQPLKVYTITFGGLISDVTLQSSCELLNREHAVLKVTPSCAAVYLDGSEHRGGVNATVEARFGNYYGTVSFTVWYPELPVEVWLSDPVLNSIKDWRLPAKKKLPSGGKSAEQSMGAYAEQLACKQRFQEAEIRVYSRFRVDDLRTGHRSYLGGLGRQLLFDITQLGQRHLKIVDGTVARIYESTEGRIMVQGLSVGSTEIRLVSPLWQIDNGATPIEVTHQKISLKRLNAFVSSGLNVSIRSSKSQQHSDAVVQLQRAFTSRFQQGAISLILVYSDDVETQLTDINRRDYILNVWSRDRTAVGVMDSHDHSKGILALKDDDGGGMLDFELRAPEGCQNPEGTPLLSASAFVQVRFPLDRKLTVRPPASEEEIRQYDSVRPITNVKKSVAVAEFSVAAVTTKYIPSPTADGRKHPSQSSAHSLTSFEITVIALVVLFVLVGSTMGLNYLVLAGRGRSYKFQRLVPLLARLGGDRQVDKTCQEWVWLSRDQLEGHSGSLSSSRYSRNSTVEVADGAEREQVLLRSTGSGSYGSAESAARSVSYRGSEVSIFISRHPSMHVHESCRTYGRRAASWNNKQRPSRVRITSNPMADSSSEQNLSTLGCISPHPDSYLTARSADVQWDSTSLGLNETELRDYFSSLRESVA